VAGSLTFIDCDPQMSGQSVNQSDSPSAKATPALPDQAEQSALVQRPRMKERIPIPIA